MSHLTAAKVAAVRASLIHNEPKSKSLPLELYRVELRPHDSADDAIFVYAHSCDEAVRRAYVRDGQPEAGHPENLTARAYRV